MDDLGRLAAEAVDAEDAQRLAVEQELQHADGAAGDLGAGEVAEERVADLVGHLLGGQLAFRGAERADFRDGVDARGNVLHQSLLAHAGERVRGGKPALVVRGAGETGIADHVADRIDVRLRGLVGRIDDDGAARVALDADRLEPHRVGVAGAALGPQEHVALNDLVRLEVHAHAGSSASTRSYSSLWRIITPLSRR